MSIDTPTRKPADVPAQINFVRVKAVIRKEPADVYNMEVENTHCFSANGLIVHNCIDALRYALETLRRSLAAGAIARPVIITTAYGNPAMGLR